VIGAGEHKRPLYRKKPFIQSQKRTTYHLQCPNPSNPNLKCTLNTLDILQINTLPPTSSCRFSPEKQELLGHTNRIVGEIVTADVCSESGQSDAADDRFLRLTGAVAPLVVVVESTMLKSVFCSCSKVHEQVYPAVSISIRCCSVVPGSSLFLSPENIPSCFNRAFPAALFTSIISACSMSLRGGIA
jgi:hypothetical protein